MTQDNHSSDKETGTRGGYPHGTIGANKALAREETDEKIEINLPEGLQFGIYVLESFGHACSLAVGSRRPEGNIRVSFIGDYVRLEANFERAKKIADTKKPFLKDWPENSGIAFGPDAGWCALDVAYKFSRRILNAIICARTIALGRQFQNQFDYLEINDPGISKWCDSFVEELESRALPSKTEWPAWQIKRDSESLYNKLLTEYESAKQKLMEVSDLASTKQNTPSVKHWRIIAWAKELYGLTIERLFKAFLDKYG